MGTNENRRYYTIVFDLNRDIPIKMTLKKASKSAIFLMDGIFLLRPLRCPYWDLTIYLTADFNHSMARGNEQNTQNYSSRKQGATRFQQLYNSGQEIYHSEAQPLDKAEILIDNNNLEAPKFLGVRMHLQPFINHLLA